jgi:hypothetical protein
MDLPTTDGLRAERSKYARRGALLCFLIAVGLLLVSLLDARPASNQPQHETVGASAPR